MSERSQHHSGSSNQETERESGLPRFLLRRVISSLVEVAGALKARPHQRFDELARHDADVRTPWPGYSVEMCRTAMHAAALEGADVKAETRRRIERAGAEWIAACLAGFIEDRPAESLPMASLEFNQECVEAMTAFQRASLTLEESDRIRARREIQDVYGAAPRLLELMDKRPIRVMR